MTVTRLGSLCTGIAGLELGLTLAGIETETVFVSDIDRGANRWLDANEAAPNLGDFTALDELPEVDLIVAGFPCQPVSTAGQRAGIHDERWLFDDITRLAGRMGTRPDLFLENVPGLLSANGGDAMGRVVYGLAGIGYHITWGTLSASAVGAPHRRNRWWGLARHASDLDQEWSFGDSGSIRRSQTPPRDSDSHAADADSGRMESPRRLEPLRHHADRCPSARPRARATSFGRYWPAVTRWETILGRPAPDPTDDGRLAPAFVEWMMGYPAGWVTDTLTNRREALHALGNAVVPQCVAAAFVALEARSRPL
jgi:DNA (cytosine-5)-methyltransferase 1